MAGRLSRRSGRAAVLGDAKACAPAWPCSAAGMEQRKAAAGSGGSPWPVRCETPGECRPARRGLWNADASLEGRWRDCPSGRRSGRSCGLVHRPGRRQRRRQTRAPAAGVSSWCPAGGRGLEHASLPGFAAGIGRSGRTLIPQTGGAAWTAGGATRCAGPARLVAKAGLRSPGPQGPGRCQPSKFTVSMIFTAAARVAAMSDSGVGSAVNSPQDATTGERSTPAFTGYS